MSKWVTHTYTARDLPERPVAPVEGYARIGGHWHKDGKPICSRPNSGYMSVVGGMLRRSAAPAVCGCLARVRMVKSRRFYCDYHAPKTGEREQVIWSEVAQP